MNKKAFSYWSDWAEFFFLVLLIAGLIIGVLSPSAFITYLVAFVAGMGAGRLMYSRKTSNKAPFVLIIIGFIIGFVIGTFMGDRKITFLLFLVGMGIGYYIFDKEIFKDVLY